jgi:YD repeat-containing protein
VQGTVEGAQDAVGQATEQAGGSDQTSGQTVERTVDESGNILETVMNENGEVIDEDLVGNVGDLPIEEEYIDDQGQVVSRAKDDSGNVYEQVFDDQGNLVEVRAA